LTGAVGPATGHTRDTGHSATGPPRLGGSLVPSFQRHGVRLTRVFVQSGVHGIDDVTVVVSKVRRQYSVSTRFDRARRVPAVASSALCPISRVRSRPQHGQKPHPLDDDDDENDACENPSRTPSRDAKKRTRKQKTYGLIGDVNTSGSATEAPFPFWTVTVGKAAGIFSFLLLLLRFFVSSKSKNKKWRFWREIFTPSKRGASTSSEGRASGRKRQTLLLFYTTVFTHFFGTLRL